MEFKTYYFFIITIKFNKYYAINKIYFYHILIYFYFRSMKNLHKFILDCDIFGYTPKMQICHRKSYKTYFGFLMTVLAVSSILLILWYSSKEIFEKSNPNIITTLYKDENPKRIDLNNSNFMISVGVTFGNDTYIIDESIYFMKIIQYTLSKPGNGSYIKSSKEIEAIKCKDANITLLTDYFKREDLENLYCMKEIDSYIEGEYGQQQYTWLEFSIHRCNEAFINRDDIQNGNKENTEINGSFSDLSYGNIPKTNEFDKIFNLNSLKGFNKSLHYYDEFINNKIYSNKNKNKCRNPNDIEFYLKGAYISIYMTDITFIPTNPHHPIELFGKNIYDLMTIKYYKEFNIFLKNVEIITDYGLLWTDEKKIQSFGYDRTQELWDYRNNTDIIYTLNFRCSNVRDIYNRSYIKIQKISSEIGGFIKIILLVGKFLINFYSKLSFFNYLASFFSEDLTNGRKESIFFNYNNTHSTIFVQKNCENNNLNKTKNNNDDIIINNAAINYKSKNEVFDTLCDDSLGNDINISDREKFYKNKNSQTKSIKEKSEKENNLITNQNETEFDDLHINEARHYKRLSTFEKIYTIFCCCLFCVGKSFWKIRSKIRRIDNTIKHVGYKFDWINFIKFQNEYEILKILLLDRDQCSILNLNLNKCYNEIMVFIKISNNNIHQIKNLIKY